MWSGVHNYRSTLDRLTYMNVEQMPIPMRFRAKYLGRSLKLGYTCGTINARAFRIHLRKRFVCGFYVWDRVHCCKQLLLNRNIIRYAKVQVVGDTFVY